MSHAESSRRSKKPQEPYPGLRPFRDDEAHLLLGRATQVVQLVDRLESSHFVAVIGGSGCGKSSLIRAGVVPRLRSHGIAGAGDYWIPIVYTPGTVKASQAANQAKPSQSPVTRLAWKFTQALMPDAPEDEKAKLTEELTTSLRQGAGFGRLVEGYHHLLPQGGPPSEKACFLFVIDQFEELFHTNNRNSDDARLVVEAVIDHFLSPHPRCYVVMTMRSEHLADCAAFLRLPDAINRSFYLVRRLNNRELREVIAGPAQVHLRMLQRAHAGLPESVHFDEAFTHRLLRDVGRIEDDPDHLPLLQHVLARAWAAARERENCLGPYQVPARVTVADLERAVFPASAEGQGGGDRLGGQESTNTLRASLENWTQFTYLQRTPRRRAQLDTLLRQLAYKDPYNGLYFQQRVDVDCPHLLPGVSKPRAKLYALLRDGFLDSVSYLFWDDENPSQVTLKVSHEALIRGWSHFKKLVDDDSESFTEFLSVLHKCQAWLKENRKPELLLGATELARLGKYKLDTVFLEDTQRRLWFETLKQYQRHESEEELQQLEIFTLVFVNESVASKKAADQKRREEEEYTRRVELEKQNAERRQYELEYKSRAEAAEHEAKQRQHEAEQQRAQAELEKAQAFTERAEALSEKAQALNRRNAAVRIGFGVSGVLGLLMLGYSALIQGSAFKGMDKLVLAKNLIERREVSVTNPKPDEAWHELKTLMDATKVFYSSDDVRKVLFHWIDSDKLREHLDWIPPVAGIRQMLLDMSPEPLLNDSLHSLLTTAIWPAQPQAQAQGQGQAPVPQPLEPQTRGCRFDADSPRLLGQGAWLPSSYPNRFIFIPLEGQDTDIRLFDTWEEGGVCRTEPVLSMPLSLNPRMLFDDKTTRMAVLLRSANDTAPKLDLYDISWRWNDRLQRVAATVTKQRTIVSDDAKLVTEVFKSAGSATEGDGVRQRLLVLPSQAMAGGLQAWAAGQSWRLFSGQALPLIPDPTDRTDWHPFQAPPSGSACAQLGQGLREAYARNVKTAGNASAPVEDQQMLVESASGMCLEVRELTPLQPPQPSVQTQAQAQAAVVQTSTDGTVSGPASPAVSPAGLVQVKVAAYSRQQLEAWQGRLGRRDADGTVKVDTLPAPLAKRVMGWRAAGPSTWRLGVNPGDAANAKSYDGWLAIEDSQGVRRVVPLSTQALYRLALEVQAAKPAKGS